MARPKGWKPLSYTTLAEVCGLLIAGERPSEIARRHPIRPRILGKMREVLRSLGVDIVEHWKHLSPQVQAEIDRLIKTTRKTNHQIAKGLGLSCSDAPRKRRRDYYAELEAAGRPLPRCECGKIFQHAERCGFGWGVKCRRLQDMDQSEVDEVVRKLRSGSPIRQIREEFHLSQKGVDALSRRLTAKQRRERERNYHHPQQAARYRAEGQALGGELLNEIRRALPGWIDGPTRDDIAAEMALAVLEGRMSLKSAIARKGEFIRHSLQEYGDRWRFIPLESDGDFPSPIDGLADDGALAAFERIDRRHMPRGC